MSLKRKLITLKTQPFNLILQAKMRGLKRMIYGIYYTVFPVNIIHCRDKANNFSLDSIKIPIPDINIIKSYQGKDEIIKNAEDFLSGYIEIFNRRIKTTTNINWHKDFLSGYVWQRDFPYLYRGGHIKSGVADIKLPWELNRFHHAILLAQASYITGEEGYFQVFYKNLISWAENNHYPQGINWANPMEVAIRIINIIWAVKIFERAVHIDTQFYSLLKQLIYFHGKNIYENLEKTNPPTNHLITDYLGLLYTGIALKNRLWITTAVSGIENEAENQILEDGVDYEFSTNYHRLVTEVFLHFLYISRLNNIEVSDKFMETVYKMISFIDAYIIPSGESPLIGDCDSGRIIYFLKNNPRDHTYILSIAKKILNYPTTYSDYQQLWFFPIFSYDSSYKQNKTDKHLYVFPKSKFAIIRYGDCYLFFNSRDMGFPRSDGHGHADTLSFILGNYYEFITDPGSYIYTGDPELRNIFRSASYHSVPIIDGRDFIKSDDKDLFSFPVSLKTDFSFSESANVIEITASHGGFFPLIIERKIIFEKGKRLIIRDSVNSDKVVTGCHEYTLNLPLHPKVEVNIEKDRIELIRNNRNLIIFPDKKLVYTTEKYSFAPGYLVSHEADKIVFRGSVEDIPSAFEYIIYFKAKST